MSDLEVVVTGLGFITCLGSDKGSVLKNLQEMKSGIDIYPPFIEDPLVSVSLLGAVKGFDTLSADPEDWNYPSKYKLGRSILRGLSPHVLYSYCSMAQAIEDAGLSSDEISNVKTGLFSASAGSSSTLTKNVNRLHALGPDKSSPKGVVSSVTGTINFNLVSIFKILGSSCGFASACASSGHALGMACDEIKMGRQDRMFVIGAEDGNGDCILPFTSMRALTTNPDPHSGSRPFDINRDGFVGTGGAVTLILERRSVAEARNAKIYASFKGWGMSSDGYNTVLPEPTGNGLERAILNALKSAGVRSDQVDYINAHAPSTQIGDRAEMTALKSIFAKGSCPAISSTKSLTGHGLSLASALEAGLSLLAMENGFCPGSANIQSLDPVAENLNIISENVPSDPKMILSNSSGFGGANVALLFEKE